MTCAEGAPHAEEKTAALTCLKSWLNLSASEAADLLILPGSLQSTQVHNLPCTLICSGCIVKTEELATQELGVDAMITLLQLCRESYLPWS